jgi:hypothetical protein
VIRPTVLAATVAASFLFLLAAPRHAWSQG